eukprot:scaffold1097_cov246-Pinguiococcus_pyrenoidosus.AAC.14
MIPPLRRFEKGLADGRWLMVRSCARVRSLLSHRFLLRTSRFALGSRRVARPSSMSKASKFSMVDPLEGGLLQTLMQKEVNSRMESALEDLKDKYADGQSAEQLEDSSAQGPTGAAYQAKAQMRQQAQQEQRRLQRQQARADAIEKQQRRDAAAKFRQRAGDGHDEDEEDSDDELLRELEEEGDAELAKIRERRLKQMKQARDQRLENLAKGHGTYREVVQDEFLPEVTGSFRVLCHFYHREFQKCAVLDMHLERLCQHHLETKFIKINAEKAPFFVQKLSVRTLPTLVYFEDGVAQSRQIGFSGIADEEGLQAEETFPTENLRKRLGQLGAIDYTAPPPQRSQRFSLDDDDE